MDYPQIYKVFLCDQIDLIYLLKLAKCCQTFLSLAKFGIISTVIIIIIVIIIITIIIIIIIIIVYCPTPIPQVPIAFEILLNKENTS